MVREPARDKSETQGAAKRAWLAGLLVWAVVLQMLVPMLGPVRLGDGTATAALGRLLPICTIDGLRLAEPGTSENDGAPAGQAMDGGWHCVIAFTPAVAPPAEIAVPAAPAGRMFAWAVPPPDVLAISRPRQPQSARGPPINS
ncbi:hypothetical protein EDC65_0585 [Stella humosa]|uniref:DUF2946 family protein n=1 Tax=Stella humosa TaxID=94 RepID=A0A3N1MK96_9PROT|nr:DUF2946 family protein [Stella humosa]ROQ01406.1 hypothetical protein EDC65_0585 [Stella humosa]BBK31782.1 hypothetical protein STHU_24160 [Stella humosa]